MHRTGNLAGHNIFLQWVKTSTVQQLLRCYVSGEILRSVLLLYRLYYSHKNLTCFQDTSFHVLQYNFKEDKLWAWSSLTTSFQLAHQINFVTHQVNSFLGFLPNLIHRPQNTLPKHNQKQNQKPLQHSISFQQHI